MKRSEMAAMGEASAQSGRQRAILVANPAAGGYRASRIAAVADALRARGIETETRLTAAPGDLERIAADPATTADVILAAGGDGTINEAVTGLLARPGARPHLALVPAGTANVLAYELGLSARPGRIAAAVATGRTAPLHTGRANGRAFMLMVSAGFDADVVHAVDPAAKRRWKQLAFVATALQRGFAKRNQPDLTVVADGRAIRCRLAVVAKAIHYGGPFRIAPDAGATRPGLHLVALLKDDPWSLIRAGAALIMGRLDRSPIALVIPVTECRIDAASPVPVQIDGEAFGFTPVAVETVSEVLRVVVPEAGRRG
ncbi:diacylglycerol/lipid kinase family protein [Prosthecodimorpha staleyi]|uniref:Diacylglycerol kinase family lipid kinase n=1 Tax=Prosthecodimorpha staleyi TaxID=2840188 RepID=A0A947GC57_9HYPH|nr:diacylglycerol kinase family protein [Prosthecodimorpha staleyi]MBT9289412.1 diacylglycerol kinase family lipid kinase [Prosthecodimorpha staleyi]